MQVALGNLGKVLVEDHDAVPLDALAALAGLPVLPGLVGGDRKIGDRFAVLSLTGFRVASQVADQNDLVDAPRHRTISLRARSCLPRFVADRPTGLNLWGRRSPSPGEAPIFRVRSPSRSDCAHGQDHQRSRRPRAQPEGRRRRPAPRPADRRHRPLGLGQILPRLRHDLRRGPAALRRESLDLCPPVPGADAKARRGVHRRALAGDLHRAEDHVAEPALDRRHGHRDPRLPAAALRPHRRALFAGDRAPHREPDREPDGRPHPGDAGRHAPLSARAGDPGPQGRVQEGARRAAQAGLHQGQDRRRDSRHGRGARPRQEAQARHRGGGGPRGRLALARHPPRRQPGDRPRAHRRAGGRRGRGERRADDLLGQVRLPGSRASPSRRSSPGSSPSTTRSAPARAATASAYASISTPTSWCRTIASA